jgi:hypothetical protein
MPHSNQDSTSPQRSASEASEDASKSESAPSFFDAYLGLLRWVRGLVFRPANEARSGAVARRLRISDRYSSLG